jgi:hypothetical protein
MAASGTVFTERNVNLEAAAVFSAQEQLRNSDLNTPYGWTNQIEFDAHLIAAPAMSFGSDNLQPDVLLDVFITRDTGTNAFVTALREAYIDLLFYNTLSIKGGFIRLDYGALNSWYNPLNIVELLNLENVYRQIMIGNAKQGFEGLPAIQFGFSAPEFMPDFKLSFEQSMICTSRINLQDNYFLSKLEGIYGSIDLALLMGYCGNSWNESDTGRFKPALGGNLSFRLPYDLMFFGETVYRYQSFRPAVSGSNIAAVRSGNFFDATARLSWSVKEPWFNNTLGTSLEYFHYGEGLTIDQYNDSYNYLTGTGLTAVYGPVFFRMDRNFQDYIYYTLTYNLTVPKLSFGYTLDAELGSGYLQHTLTVTKSYDTVMLMASIVFNQVSAKKYSLSYFDRDFAVYIEALISI